MQTWPIADAVIPQSVHTITQTRDWIIVGDCAFKVEPQVLAGGARTEPNNLVSPLYLIRKDALEATPPDSPVACTTLSITPEINHYYATYDDTDGVQVLFEHSENTDIAMTQQTGDLDALGRPCDPALRGLYGMPMSPDRTSLVVFDPDAGTVTHRAEQREPDLLWSRQLNAMDWSDAGRSHPTVHHTVHQGWRPEGVTQQMLELYADRVDRSLLPGDETAPLVATSSLPDLQLTGYHELALDDFPSSPIYVPHAGGSEPGGHDGYVVVPIMNDAGFRVEVFDAADVARGPLATLSEPGFTMPFVLHAAWMRSAVPAPDVERVRFSDELGRARRVARRPGRRRPRGRPRARRRRAHGLTRPRGSTIPTPGNFHGPTRSDLGETGVMGRFYDHVPEQLAEWLEAQPVFFVASAPLGEDGHVNVSPKGGDTFRVLDAGTVAYLDLTGSGAETTAHLRQNGRLTIMFCAFDGKPNIVRLFGTGQTVHPDQADFDDLAARFPTNPGTRGVVRLAVEKVGTSCGYGVPLMQLVGPRQPSMSGPSASPPTSCTPTGRPRTPPASTDCPPSTPPTSHPAEARTVAACAARSVPSPRGAG